MFEFLVEAYAPDETPSTAARHAEEVSLAADHVSETGTIVRLQRAIFVPDEDSSFYLFESSSADAVHDAITRAGLRPDRITDAVSTDTKPTRFAEGYTDDPHA